MVQFKKFNWKTVFFFDFVKKKPTSLKFDFIRIQRNVNAKNLYKNISKIPIPKLRDTCTYILKKRFKLKLKTCSYMYQIPYQNTPFSICMNKRYPNKSKLYSFRKDHNVKKKISVNFYWHVRIQTFSSCCFRMRAELLISRTLFLSNSQYFVDF